MYDAARVPSPKDGTNGVSKPLVPVARPEMGATTEATGATPTTALQAKSEDAQPGEEEEEEPKSQPVLVKKPRREILDHDRKRRVELKCMELQEMMEEQGYTEEEIRQKVSTFRQMLMDKEGVITRDGSQPVINHTHYYPEDDGELAGDEDYYADDYQSDNRVKRKSSSSPSPRRKKRKKKKSGRRRSRFGSSSPSRKEKKKKSSKKHKRDRSPSGSSKKRRYRSGSPKDKHKDKNKQKKRSPAETPRRSAQRQGSCDSSRSASLSSTGSTSKSPSRHKKGGKKAASASLSPGPDSPAACHNGDPTQRTHNCHKSSSSSSRLNHTEGDKVQDKLRIAATGSASIQSTLSKEQKLHSASSRSKSVQMCTTGEGGSEDSVSSRRAAQRGRNKSCHSPAHSSDSARSHHNHTHRGGRSGRHQRKTKSSHSSKRHHRSGRGQAHNRSPSASPGRRSRTSSRKKEVSRSKQRHRSSSWSSGHSSLAHRDRGVSKIKSPHNRQNTSRERDSPNRCDSDADSRARRRSRSYSPIRKRRRDSPSFMEARRITSP